MSVLLTWRIYNTLRHIQDAGKGIICKYRKNRKFKSLVHSLKIHGFAYQLDAKKKKKNGLWSYLAAVRFDAVEYDLVLILPLLALAPCSFWRFMLYSSVAMMYDLP